MDTVLGGLMGKLGIGNRAWDWNEIGLAHGVTNTGLNIGLSTMA